MEFRTRIKKWGNSLGITIPKEIVLRENLRLGEEVMFDLRKKIIMKELFGSLKNWKIDSQKVKDELRKEWSR